MKFQLCFVALFLLAVSSWAQPVSGLYDARVAVPNQQIDSRQVGAKQGLIEVLQKVSGFTVPAENQVVQRALDIADQYLYQFSYAGVQKDEWDATIPPGSSWLKMRFEAQSIQRIIKQANLPLWGNNRPTVLLWLIKEENGRSVITDDANDKAYNAVKNASQVRGIPIVLPVYDLEDAMRLPQESLWGLFSNAIAQASARYDAQSTLAGRAYKNARGNWVGQWRFYFKGREFNYEFETQEFSQQVLAGLSASGEILANTFAIKPNDVRSDAVTIEVSKVETLKDYAALMDYLEGLTMTKRVSVEGVKGSDITLKLTLNGTLTQLKQVIALGSKLSETNIRTQAPAQVASLGLLTQPLTQPSAQTQEPDTSTVNGEQNNEPIKPSLQPVMPQVIYFDWQK